MHQAILITAYKNIGFLNDLLNSFNNDFSIFVHIDKKSKITPEQIAKLSHNKNVKLISQAYNINWGGLNHLKAILLLLEEAFKHGEVEYFHVITGHDYPIKSSEQITKVMLANRGSEFMEYHPLPYSSWPQGGIDRLSYYNFYDVVDGRVGWGRTVVNVLAAIQRKIGFKRSFYKDFPALFGGSTYWTLSRECIAYVFDYMKQYPQYLKRFKHSFCAEEIFFQSIILNSPFKDKVVNDNLRYIVWEVRNGNFPANLDESDLEAIQGSKALFARKFESNCSEKLLEKIKENLNGKAQ